MRALVETGREAALAGDARHGTQAETSPDPVAQAAWLRALERSQWQAWLDHPVLTHGPGSVPPATGLRNTQPLFARPPAGPADAGSRSGDGAGDATPQTALQKAAGATAAEGSAAVQRQDGTARPALDAATAPVAQPPGARMENSGGEDATATGTPTAFLPALAAAVQAALPAQPPAGTGGGAAVAPPVVELHVAAALPGTFAPRALGSATAPATARVTAPVTAPVTDPAVIGLRLPMLTSAATPRRLPAGTSLEAEQTVGAAVPATPPTEPETPLRVHAQWLADGVRIWIGADEALGMDGATLARLCARLQHLCGVQGVALLSLVCNGRPVAQASGARRDAGQSPTRQGMPQLPPAALAADTVAAIRSYSNFEEKT